MTDEIVISDVIVPARFRRDMGDIDGLAASIKEVGLLQPIVVDENNMLLCGQRRLLAVERLGWKKIGCVVVSDLLEIIPRMKAERDENTQRKEFTPAEAVEVGRRLEAIEKPKALARMKAGNQPSSNLDEGAKGRVDEKVAAAVGMSKDTYRRAKAVVAASEAPDASQETKAVAEEMNRTGKVTTAFRKVQEEKNGTPSTVPPKAKELIDAVKELHSIVKKGLMRISIVELREVAKRIDNAANPFVGRYRE